jgi:hydrogenase expression/formation protein HypD
MKYVAEFRDRGRVRETLEEIRRTVTRSWTIMEICGGQTHSIVKHGLDELLPEGIRLVHGPGCPVCVTPLETIDRAIAIASRPEVTFVSFGDMLRVPGSCSNLLRVKSAGGDVRVVYSPLDAVRLAQTLRDRQVVFFGIGFETTAPANAMAILQASRLRLPNFSMLVSHVLVPPAIEALLSSPDNVIQAFLAAGHVCTVMGWTQYEPIATRYRVPVVVTGFEPLDIVQGTLMAVRQLEHGRAEVDNQYTRSVCRRGNPAALAVLRDIFEVCDRKWRGIGTIPQSGFRIHPQFATFDAERRFPLDAVTAEEPSVCVAGLVLRGRAAPSDCPAFGTACTPERPLGAPMVSSEGACAAYYHFRRYRAVTTERIQQ